MKNNKPYILIVEDEIIIGMNLKNKLQSMGYNVCGVVNSWEDAAEKLEQTQIDLVLMDISIKGEIDGIELGRQIIEIMKIPVIFITVHSDYLTIQRADHIQHSGYIIKPFKEEDLKVTIQKALRKAHSLM